MKAFHLAPAPWRFQLVGFASGGAAARKMQRVPQILQLPVVIDRGGSFSSQLQSLQKLDFLFGDIAAQGRILQEFFEPRLYAEGVVGFLFDEFKSLRAANGEPAV